MKTDLTIQQIDEKIALVKQQLLELGPMHPGSLSSQYHVCGKPGCKCVTSPKPKPHGPYCKLNYAYHGKVTCRFVRAEAVAEITSMVEIFKTFRQLTDQWVSLSIARALRGPLAVMPRNAKPASVAKSTRKIKSSPRKPSTKL